MPEMPSKIQMAKNLAKSIVENISSVIQGNELTISEDDFQTRMNICKGIDGHIPRCELYMEKENRCYDCGCYLNIKAKLFAMVCPLSKWPPVNPIVGG